MDNNLYQLHTFLNGDAEIYVNNTKIGIVKYDRRMMYRAQTNNGKYVAYADSCKESVNKLIARVASNGSLEKLDHLQ